MTNKPLHNYRADIDGLRAIAVLAVLFFHVDMSLFQGGFVGVDIFFVISGFLITKIIWQDIQDKRFSLLSFYERRVRRIIPALFAVVLASAVAGWFILSPLDYKDFAQSISANSVFSSNLLFWKEDNYFGLPASTKPLLHTWSISIEEQFYIFFPFILMAGVMVKLKTLPWVLLSIFGLSLSFSIYVTAHSPSAAFYLLPMRAWELMMGALLALQIIPPLKQGASGKLPDIAAFIGLGSIFISIFTFTKEMAFPGYAAALPVFGTALLIWANANNKTLIGQILSYKFFVGLGLISYSFYLWHWPLIVYSKYLLDGALPLPLTALIIIASILLAYLSWKFIEQPFRRKQFLKTRTPLFGAAILCLGGLFIFGALGHITQGFNHRLPDAARPYSNAVSDFNPTRQKCFTAPNPLERIAKDTLCRMGNLEKSKADFILWGDSHADALYPAFAEQAEAHNKKGIFAGLGGCAPVAGITAQKQSQCGAFNDAVLAYILENKIQNVFLVGRWNTALWGRTQNDLARGNHQNTVNNEANLQGGLSHTIDALNQAGIKTTFVLQAPFPDKNVPRFLTRQAMKNKNIMEGDYKMEMPLTLARHEKTKKFIAQFNGLKSIDPTALLCPDEGGCFLMVNHNVLYRDDHHLSTQGALYLSPMLVAPFERIQ